MMEPRIQYVTSKDGAKIAYWMLGEGGVPLLMQPPLTYSNISLEWQIPELRAWYEHLCASRLILRWDSRGQGSSERRVSYSWDNAVDDLESVAGLIKQDVFDLLAFTGPNMWAMQFAADHPERLRKLILWAPLAKGYGPRGRERVESLIALAERDWDLAVEAFSHATVGWSRGEQAHFWAKFIRDTVTQDDFVLQWRDILRVWSERDLSSVIPRISTPTLVLDLENPGVSRRHAMLIASTIQHAQLLRLEGSLAPHDNEQGKQAIDEFLGYESGSLAARTIHPSGTAIILFADIVDSTAHTNRRQAPRRRRPRRLHQRPPGDRGSAGLRPRRR
jgi:pimeloyl-ACP methyl ester carboxylesterase